MARSLTEMSQRIIIDSPVQSSRVQWREKTVCGCECELPDGFRIQENMCFPLRTRERGRGKGEKKIEYSALKTECVPIWSDKTHIQSNKIAYSRHTQRKNANVRMKRTQIHSANAYMVAHGPIYSFELIVMPGTTRKQTNIFHMHTRSPVPMCCRTHSVPLDGLWLVNKKW